MSISLHPERLKRYKDIARVNKLLDAVTNNDLKVNIEVMLFFLAAAGGGAWLAFNILTSDKPARRKR